MLTYSISNSELIHVLEPGEQGSPIREVDLSRIFREILERAHDFVATNAGAIFLLDTSGGSRNSELVIAAGFGDGAEQLMGGRLADDQGIAGQVLQQGQVYVSASPSSELLYGASPGGATGAPRAGSVVALPLRVGTQVVGVLELVKDPTADAFDEHELGLLEVFAQTISASIANAVEAQRSREMARRDDLTRLFNDRFMHHSLTELLHTAIDSDLDCGVLFLDLDKFKTINDTYGHLVGSRVLMEVGGILRQVLPGPSVPARYGGDEFVILLPEASEQEAFWVAETIRKTLEAHLFLARPDLEDPVNYPKLSLSGITASIGVATLKSDILPMMKGSSDPVTLKNEILRLADTRMYRAKDLGRNRSVWSRDSLRTGDPTATQPIKVR